MAAAVHKRAGSSHRCLAWLTYVTQATHVRERANFAGDSTENCAWKYRLRVVYIYMTLPFGDVGVYAVVA